MKVNSHIRKLNIKLSIPLLVTAFVWGLVSYGYIFGTALGIGLGCTPNCEGGEYFWIEKLTLTDKIVLFTLGLPGLLVDFTFNIIPDFLPNPFGFFLSSFASWFLILLIGPLYAYLIL